MSKLIETCLLLILIFALFGLVPSINGDIPPPIEYVQTETGGLFCIASNVSMPDVIVDATMRLTGSWIYDINVSCAFTITSLIKQNLTTAFVYPSIWTEYTTEQNISIHEFDIHVNDSTTEFVILSFEEFKSKYDLNQTDWYYVSDCDFALFNFSIASGEPIIVDVRASFSAFSVGHDFIFEYIVDTARRWEGDTHETIRLQFDRRNDTKIIEYRYWPLSNYDFSVDNYSAALAWDFSIHDFEYDRVSFIVQQREYPTYHHIPFPSIPVPDDLVLAVGAVAVLVFVGSILAIKRLQHH
jgi:hypothetical protein